MGYVTRTQKWLGPAALALSMAGLAAGAVSAQVAPARAPDPAAVKALVASMTVALDALPSGASQADAEAALTYALDQAKQPEDVNLAALQQLRSSKTWPDPTAKAIDALLARRGATGGTGANALSSALGGGPGFGAGGGGTDYTGN